MFGFKKCLCIIIILVLFFSINLYAEKYAVLIIGDEASSIPERLTASNYPNPFNPNTTISYSLPIDGKIEISIYNMKGQFVIQLVSGSQTEGHYEVVWNGNDNAGKQVSSGIYYYQLKACDKIINKKMLMLK